MRWPPPVSSPHFASRSAVKHKSAIDRKNSKYNTRQENNDCGAGTEPSAGPLFSDHVEDGDIESGTIYVLRSNSDLPYIKGHRDVVHKIGVTGGDLRRRFANAKLDPTFLMADVEVVATYELSNINRVKLENLLNRFFEPAKLNVQCKDRMGNPIVPREWFLVPLFVIDRTIEIIRSGEIVNYRYDVETQRILETL